MSVSTWDPDNVSIHAERRCTNERFKAEFLDGATTIDFAMFLFKQSNSKLIRRTQMMEENLSDTENLLSVLLLQNPICLIPCGFSTEVPLHYYYWCCCFFFFYLNKSNSSGKFQISKNLIQFKAIKSNVK